jgi:hypothetical protein
MTQQKHSPPRFTCHGSERRWLRTPTMVERSPFLESQVDSDAANRLVRRNSQRGPKTKHDRLQLEQLVDAPACCSLTQRGHALMQGGTRPDPQKAVLYLLYLTEAND